MTTPDPRALRDAFGSFMTGVCVVTTCSADGTVHGFTANSFSSVSMDPPLLLVCPGQFLSSYAAFTGCRHFGVSVLAEGQEDVSNVFASFKGDRFAQVPHRLDAQGVPLIDGAITQFSCQTYQVVPAGDHSVLIGKITDFTTTGAAGLGYAQGRYFSLGLEKDAVTHEDGSEMSGAIIELLDQVLLEKTPAGYRPLQVDVPDHADLRGSLARSLTERGVEAEIRQVYSAFENTETGVHWTYFLADSTFAAQGPSTERIPVQALAGLRYATPAIGEMMNRYALEARTRNFSLYQGNSLRGDVQPLPKRT